MSTEIGHRPVARELPHDRRHAVYRGRRGAHDRRRRRRDRHRSRHRAPGGLLHGQGGHDAGRAAQLVIAVTMPLWAGLPREGLRVARDAQPRERAHPGGVRPLARATGSGARSSCSPTCGSPTWSIPIYAGLDRLPELPARGVDRPRRQGRAAPSASVVLPLLVPSIVAGSIFTFSLTLGDFYINRLLGGTTQFIGNNIYTQLRRQPAACRGLRHGADPDHGRLPHARPGPPAPSRSSRRVPPVRCAIALRLFMGLVLVVLYFPLLYVARLSVATSKGFAWPPSGFTLDHWDGGPPRAGPARRAHELADDRLLGHAHRARARVARGRGPVSLQVLRPQLA